MLHVSVCGSFQALNSLRKEWGNLVERSPGASIFMSWEWVEAGWRYSHSGAAPLVLVARQDGRLVGVLPLARTTRFRVFKALEVLCCFPGGYPLADYGGLMAEGGMEAVVWQAMLRYLQGLRWSILDLRNLRSEDDDTTSAMRRLYSEVPSGLKWSVKINEADVCRRITLAPTFDEYLAQLSSNARQNLRRKLRKLEADGHRIETVDVADPEARREAFEALFRYHQARWTEDNARGAFPDSRSRDLHLHLASNLAHKGEIDLRAVRLSTGEIAGVIYNFRQGKNGYFYQLGFSNDERWAPYSLGVCLLADSIRGAISAGCTEFDLLRGDHDYKKHFGGSPVHNLHLTVYRPSWLPVLENRARSLKRKLKPGTSGSHTSKAAQAGPATG